ncbi:pyridoxine 5'-phosphate synthase [bacterium]|nr:pyridoxine 5'-phosphate synthase [bacterium]
MKPRIFVSLELYPRVASVIPGMDELDIAYAAARAGAAGIVVSAGTEAFHKSGMSLFDRPGLPLLCVHASLQQIDSVNSLGNAPDRVLISDEGRPVTHFDPVVEFRARIEGARQEVGVLVEPEPQALKQAAKAGVQWVAFPTATLNESVDANAAQQELLRLRTATMLSARNSLRVMLYGDLEQHLASAAANLEGVEEIVPIHTLWTLATRHGWEQALSIFTRWIE